MKKVKIVACKLTEPFRINRHPSTSHGYAYPIYASIWALTAGLLISEPLSNSLVEEWRQARQTEGYWQSMRTRLQHFLDKNPSFKKLLIKKFLISEIENKPELIEHFLH